MIDTFFSRFSHPPYQIHAVVPITFGRSRRHQSSETIADSSTWGPDHRFFVSRAGSSSTCAPIDTPPSSTCRAADHIAIGKIASRSGHNTEVQKDDLNLVSCSCRSTLFSPVCPTEDSPCRIQPWDKRTLLPPGRAGGARGPPKRTVLLRRWRCCARARFENRKATRSSIVLRLSSLSSSGGESPRSGPSPTPRISISRIFLGMGPSPIRSCPPQGPRRAAAALMIFYLSSHPCA